MKREQNGNFNVLNFRRFLFGMSPDVPTVKVRVFASDLKFWIEVKLILVLDILNQI